MWSPEKTNKKRTEALCGRGQEQKGEAPGGEVTIQGRVRIQFEEHWREVMEDVRFGGDPIKIVNDWALKPSKM